MGSITSVKGSLNEDSWSLSIGADTGKDGRAAVAGKSSGLRLVEPDLKRRIFLGLDSDLTAPSGGKGAPQEDQPEELDMYDVGRDDDDGAD